MRKGIVITTSEYTKDYLKPLLESIKTDYPIILHCNSEKIGDIGKCTSDLSVVFCGRNGWEIAGIQTGKEKFDEFIHLMDTTLIKDNSLFEKLFAIDGNVFLTNGGYHYMGKFVSNTLGQLPTASNKEEAIQLELHWYHGPRTYFTPDLPVHTNNFEEKYGQRRMRLENDYMIKWKGTYR